MIELIMLYVTAGLVVVLFNRKRIWLWEVPFVLALWPVALLVIVLSEMIGDD